MWLRYVAVLSSFVIIAAAASAQPGFVASLSDGQYSIYEAHGHDRIDMPGALVLRRQGYPELPCRTLKFYVETDRTVIGIRFVSSRRELLGDGYLVYPVQPPTRMGLTVPFQAGHPEAYASTEPYPSEPVLFAGSGLFRGHRVVDVLYCPFEYIAATGQLYLHSAVEFELVYDNSQVPPSAPQRWDSETVRALTRLVNNPAVVPKAISADQRDPLASEDTNTVSLVIVTDLEMRFAYERYADFKNKTGCPTEVMPVEVINGTYQDDSLALKIRHYIQDCYATKNTSWVLLGADADVIPCMRMNLIGFDVMTDMYYSCLDHCWNEDGDSLFGEPAWYGDTVDYLPEVWVGRIPTHNLVEADAVVDKLLAYQQDTNVVGYQTHALFTSSHMSYQFDGMILNSHLSSHLPPGTFTIQNFHQAPSSNVYAAMNDGRGILVNSSHSQNSGNFLTLHWNDPFQRDAIDFTDIDTLSNDGEYGIFFDFTCFNCLLDSANALAKHFLLNPTGGGVGSIGSTHFTWSHIYDGFHSEIFARVFDSAETRLGKALSDSKMNLTPQMDCVDNIYRFGIFAYIYLGDPQLRIWTDTPVAMDVACPDTLIAGTHEVTVSVTALGQPVPQALVCMSMGSTIYGRDYTNADGEVTFTANLQTQGYVSVAATKQNHFYAEDTIFVRTLDPGCPILYVWNGYDYDFHNNILAHSEERDNTAPQREFHPVYSVPTTDGTIRLKVAEEESEVSRIRSMRGYGCIYASDQTLAFTHYNRFRVLSGDSLLPVAATFNGEVEVTELLCNQDGRRFSSVEPGFLTVRYVDSAFGEPNRKPTLGGGGGIDPPPGGKGHSKTVAVGHGGIELDNVMHVYALTGDSNWTPVNSIYPRFSRFNLYTELQDYFIGDTLTVKLEWEVSVEMDYLPYFRFSPGVPEMAELALTRANHSIEGDVVDCLESESSGELRLRGGEMLELEFAANAPESNRQLAFVLETYGRYDRGEAAPLGGGRISQFANYPNPFNPTTILAFSLDEPAEIEVVIYNLLGQRVVTLAERSYAAGSHKLTWNGTNDAGVGVASGLYFAQIRTGAETHTKKLMLVR